MNVFISWSGEPSLAVANVLYEWLPQIINAIDPWVSTIDIRKGQRWSSEIAGALKEAKIGIFCLSPDNTDSQWLLFEAGAISKSVDESYACTYLFNLKPSEITGPLSQFQATVANKTDTLKLVQTINKALAEPRTQVQLQQAFDMWWPKLNEKLEEIRSVQPQVESIKPKRASADLLEEILSITRQLAVNSSQTEVQFSAISQAIRQYYISTKEAIFSIKPIAAPVTTSLMDALNEAVAQRKITATIPPPPRSTSERNRLPKSNIKGNS